MDSTHITLDGVRLEVAHIAGAADRAPLLFLHEGLGSVALWPQRGRDWPAELCAATGRAGVLVSRRGYGQSDPIPGVRGPHQSTPPASALWPHGRHTPRYMHHEAEVVLPRLRAALGLQQAVLVGHSDGATIALLHAASHPSDAVVVMAPHLFVEPMTLAAIEQARQAYLDTGPQGLRQKLARFHADVDCAFWQWNDIWLDPAFARYDITHECRRITCPVLALQGVQDAYGTLAQLERLQQAAPQTRTLALEACGHSPHRDQPDALTTAVRDFLQTVTV
jgi:pimeloyl-ACP methyl ester carboxylesterase